jgi:hypothetical protein
MSTSEILPALPDSPLPLPTVIAGARASEHFLEFFAATIRNRNTRGLTFRLQRSSSAGVNNLILSSAQSGRCTSPPTGLCGNSALPRQPLYRLPVDRQEFRRSFAIDVRFEMS